MERICAPQQSSPHLGRAVPLSPVPGMQPRAHAGRLAAFSCSQNAAARSCLTSICQAGNAAPAPLPRAGNVPPGRECPPRTRPLSTCGQVEDVVALPVGRGHLVHADFLVAVFVVEQGAPGGRQRLHPLLHLGVAVGDLEGLAGRVLPGGDALRAQGTKRGQKAPSEAGGALRVAG